MSRSSAEAVADRSAGVARRQALVRFASRNGIVIAFFLIAACLAVANDYFLSVVNLLNVLRQVSINGILAIGMTFVILTGGIDLSIGSTLAIAGMVSASLVVGAAPYPPVVAVLAGILTGVGFGAVNGALIARFAVPPFVATLGMLSMARGATLLYSGGRPIPSLSVPFRWIGQGFVIGIPVPVIIFAVVLVLAWITLRFTVFGRWVYAVGGNARSAQTSGIPTRTVIFAVYVIMGGLAGLAGPVLTARTTAALPQAGLGYELDAIAAVVIGGTSLNGGIGSVGYTLVGALIIGVISNGLDLMGVSSYYQQIVKGAIIVIAVLIDRSRHRNA
jgi:putative xylitol transport system permease protein